MVATEKIKKANATQVAIILNCAGPEFISVYDHFEWSSEGDREVRRVLCAKGKCRGKRIPILERPMEGTIRRLLDRATDNGSVVRI